MEYTQLTFSDVRNLFIVKICSFNRIPCLVISYVMWFNLICLSEKITCDYFDQSLRCIFYLSDKITCDYFEHGLNGILCLSEIITCDYFEHKLNCIFCLSKKITCDYFEHSLSRIIKSHVIFLDIVLVEYSS